MTDTNFTPANVNTTLPPSLPTTTAADDISSLVDNLRDGVSSILSSPGAWWRKVWNLAELVVPEVEKFDSLLSNGADKKQLALDLISKLYFKFINISFIPDSIEDWLVRSLASVAIDRIVGIFNRSGVFKHT